MGKCPHCPSCGKKKSCGNHHVYVIELKEEVLDDPAFCPDRPSNAGPHSKCYYVGETKHRVDCRFTQHGAKKRRRKKEGATFDCTCKTGKVVKVEFDAYNEFCDYRLHPADAIPNGYKALDLYIRRTLGIVRRLSGTSKMGPDTDASAVVAEYSNEKGVTGLSVGEVSVTPRITLSRTIYAMLIMIGK